MKKRATISKDGAYRWTLSRIWNGFKPAMVWIMLNPSTADADKDDATIRVIVERARRMGYGGVLVLNLFAYRATDPRDLKGAVAPIGARNNDALMKMIKRYKMGTFRYVMAAWGNHGSYLARDAEVLDILRRNNVPVHAIKLTKVGNPCHPLRQSYDTEPFTWRTWKLPKEKPPQPGRRALDL